MSGNKKYHTNTVIPDTLVCIGYKSIYDDYDTVVIKDVIKDIPTQVILDFIVEQQNRVLYAFSDSATQKQQIRDFCKYVSTETKERIWKFTKSQPKCMIYETYGCALAYGYALENYIPFEEEEDYFELCEDEYEKVFKLILYCNQNWTDKQMPIDGNVNMIDLSLKIDLPISEFKLYKDFRFQLSKAVTLFKFMEADKYYQQILPYFYQDKKLVCWQEYIARIFELYSVSLKGRYISANDNLGDASFYEQYCIDVENCVNLTQKHNALNYFRNKFLFDCGERGYLLLNANLLVDKLYQGMRFDIWSTIKKHGITNKSGKKYNGWPDFNSNLGTDFSEPELLYALMRKTFTNHISAFFTGAELHAKGIEGEPDLYMRIGSILYLFEYKDVTLGDEYKYSEDISVIKQAIKDRICLNTGEKRKGAGQLYYNINRIVNDGLMNTLDPEVKNITDIVPIIITTDRAFSAIGVEALVVEEYSKWEIIYFKGFTAIPIVVDFDILIDLSFRLHEGILDIKDIVKSYLYQNAHNLTPFSIFVLDKYKRKNNMISTEENEYMFSDVISYLG